MDIEFYAKQLARAVDQGYATDAEVCRAFISNDEQNLIDLFERVKASGYRPLIKLRGQTVEHPIVSREGISGDSDWAFHRDAMEDTDE